MQEKRNILDLFAGTRSWVKPYDEDPDFETYDVELNYLYPHTTCRDILTWEYKTDPWVKDKRMDVVYASPPCNLYFTNLKGSISKYTEKDVALSLALVNRTIEIIEWFKPRYFLIENPVGKMRRHYPKIFDCPPLIVDYCQYGMDYKKPTYLWTNINLHPKRCTHVRHDVYIQLMEKDKDHGKCLDDIKKSEGAIFQQAETYNAVIAPLLCKEIHDIVCEGFRNNNSDTIRDLAAEQRLNYAEEEARDGKEEIEAAQKNGLFGDAVPIPVKAKSDHMFGDSLKGNQVDIFGNPSMKVKPERKAKARTKGEQLGL